MAASDRRHEELDRYLLDGERLVTAVHQHWGKVAEPVASAVVGLHLRVLGGRPDRPRPRPGQHHRVVGLVRRRRADGLEAGGVAARLVRRHRQAAAAVLRLHHPQGVDDAADEGHRHVLRAVGAGADPRLRPVRDGVGRPGPGAAQGQLGPRTRPPLPRHLRRDLRRRPTTCGSTPTTDGHDDRWDDGWDDNQPPPPAAYPIRMPAGTTRGTRRGPPAPHLGRIRVGFARTAAPTCGRGTAPPTPARSPSDLAATGATTDGR